MRKDKLNYNSNGWPWLIVFIFFVVAVLLAICSKCSFLYTINDWSDVNIYFTIGKSLSKGKVLYVDLVDNKGPLIFFLFNIASRISETSLIGVYIMEIISISSCLYFGIKYIGLYIKERRVFYIIIPFLSMAIIASRAFGMGGSAEELCLGFLGYSLFSVLIAVKENRLLTGRELFLNGICAACVLWIKYTILGLYIGLVIFVVYWYIREKQYKQLGTAIVKFLFGVVIVTIFVCSYFVINNAMNGLFEVYIKDNIFMYPTTMSLVGRVIWIVRAVWMFIKINLFFSILLEVGLFYLFIKRKREFACILLSFVFLSFTMYMGGKMWNYYGMVFAPFAIAGGIVPCKLVANLLSKFDITNLKIAILLGGSLIISGILAYCLSENTFYLKYQRKDYAQYRFAEKINQIEHAKIINYRCMDRGFYLAANLVPDCKYYFVMNMDLPEMREEQDYYVESGGADFVITRDMPLSEFKIDAKYYKKVCETNAIEEGKKYTYYLYGKYDNIN